MLYLEHTMRSRLTVSCPQALLEVGELDLERIFLRLDTKTYDYSASSPIWWQETWEFTDRDWVRLSAPLHIDPQCAFWTLLSHRERPSIPLPILLTTFFLISDGDPDPDVQCDLFSYVTYILSGLLPLLPPQLPLASGITLVEPDQLEQLTSLVMDAILHGVKPLPWPTYDGDGFMLVLELVQRFWSFPPDLVRCFLDDGDTEDDTGMKAVHDYGVITSSGICLDGLRLLSRMSMIRGWYDPLPRVRGLLIRSQRQLLPLVVDQALLLMHPDAPPISDTLLAWLCDGTLGNKQSVPMVDLWDLDRVVEKLQLSSVALLDHTSRLRQEAAAGRHRPTGQWRFQVSAKLPILRSIPIVTVCLVASPEGMWVRLMSSDSWGVLLWWKPQVEPPTSLSFVDPISERSAALVLHATLWELWRDLCVTGSLAHLL
jgi:hypothetical protein